MASQTQNTFNYQKKEAMKGNLTSQLKQCDIQLQIIKKHYHLNLGS